MAKKKSNVDGAFQPLREARWYKIKIESLSGIIAHAYKLRWYFCKSL